MKAAEAGLRWMEALKRYKYVFLVAAVGALLLLWPGGETAEKAAPAEETDLFQAAQLERKLEKALTQVEGAGEVTVVLTLDAGPRQVIAQDGSATQEGEKTAGRPSPCFSPRATVHRRRCASRSWPRPTGARWWWPRGATIPWSGWH